MSLLLLLWRKITAVAEDLDVYLSDEPLIVRSYQADEPEIVRSYLSDAPIVQP